MFFFVIGQQNELKKADISETRTFDLKEKLSVGEASTSSGGKPSFVDLRYVYDMVFDLVVLNKSLGFIPFKKKKELAKGQTVCIDMWILNYVPMVWFGLVSVNQQV